ncbi:Uncharacterised protein [Bordetella pertussis]|nr:Uncharacterised protein [Bordetella pertussis]
MRALAALDHRHRQAAPGGRPGVGDAQHAGAHDDHVIRLHDFAASGKMGGPPPCGARRRCGITSSSARTCRRSAWTIRR